MKVGINQVLLRKDMGHVEAAESKVRDFLTHGFDSHSHGRYLYLCIPIWLKGPIQVFDSGWEVQEVGPTPEQAGMTEVGVGL